MLVFVKFVNYSSGKLQDIHTSEDYNEFDVIGLYKFRLMLEYAVKLMYTYMSVTYSSLCIRGAGEAFSMSIFLMPHIWFSNFPPPDSLHVMTLFCFSREGGGLTWRRGILMSDEPKSKTPKQLSFSVILFFYIDWIVSLLVHSASFFYIKQVVTLRRQLHSENVVFGLEK